jgi:hypothetical protein
MPKAARLALACLLCFFTIALVILLAERLWGH